MRLTQASGCSTCCGGLLSPSQEHPACPQAAAATAVPYP